MASPLQQTHDAQHLLYLYEEEQDYARTIAEFLAGGLKAGHPALVIATAEHRSAIATALAELGPEMAGAIEVGRVVFRDAAATLAEFCEKDRIDRRGFFETIGAALALFDQIGAPPPVYVHGEMVDLLITDGYPETAELLEGLWNEIARDHRFHLLCAYSTSRFGRADNIGTYETICGQHSHVLPSVSWRAADESRRLREIARLEQRAYVLESELQRRRELEDELRAALERESRVRRESESASRAKSDFLAVMSHELRTPLNAIAGYVDLMEIGIHGALTDDQREDLRRIRRSQSHLLGLISEVLDYARIESGTVRYELTDVDVGSAIESVVILIRPQVTAKALRLTVEHCPPDAVVRADRDKLQRILLNLMANAVKFTAPGGEITVRCDIADAAGEEQRLRVHVSDTGAGIPADKLEAIFEPFIQAQRGLTREHEGTGLGLTISRDLAAGMSGTLTVESVEGKGSTFTLSLPLARASA